MPGSHSLTVRPRASCSLSPRATVPSGLSPSVAETVGRPRPSNHCTEVVLCRPRLSRYVSQRTKFSCKSCAEAKNGKSRTRKTRRLFTPAFPALSAKTFVAIKLAIAL